MLTINELKDVYRCLYDCNVEAAEDDYLEYFEAEFSPEMLNGYETLDDIRGEVIHLVEEVLNDTGNEDLTKKWLINAGGDDDLLVACGFASNSEGGEADA